MGEFEMTPAQHEQRARFAQERAEAAEAAKARALEANDAALSDRERKAIMALHRLAARWPKTLKLVSMGGTLYVVRVGDERLYDVDHAVCEQAVIQTFDGIPNDGGDW